jgi:multiple sugar transport system substrate-binding protein
MIKAATGAYLMAHARDMKDIVIRTGIQPGEGLYYDQDSNVLVTSPRFAVRAFELARQVRQLKLDAASVIGRPRSEGFRAAPRHADRPAPGWPATQQLAGARTPAGLAVAPLPEAPLPPMAAPSSRSPGANPANKAMAWQFIQLDDAGSDAAAACQDAFRR